MLVRSRFRTNFADFFWFDRNRSRYIAIELLCSRRTTRPNLLSFLASDFAFVSCRFGSLHLLSFAHNNQ